MLKKILNDPLLLFLGGITLLLMVFNPESAGRIPSLIHWPTISALTALLLITTAINQSGLLQHGAHRLIRAIPSRRLLWGCLILFSTLSAMFLTNDIALFLIIPFTLKLNNQTALNIRPLLILETIAVNVGSMVTPIGNPQNIYLWQKTGIPFFSFVMAMLPPMLIQLGLLLVAVFFISRGGSLPLLLKKYSPQIDYQSACSGVILLLTYLTADNLGLNYYASGGVVLFFLILNRSVLRSADWSLLVLFLFLFIDVGIIAEFPFLQSLNNMLNLSAPLSIVSAGAAYSQVISNVPATLLLSHYTDQWKYLAWGVNLGANGTLIASFANLITLRLARSKKIVVLYHLYAIPFLIFSALLVYLLIL